MIAEQDIGGAVVRRRFDLSGRTVLAGAYISRDQLMKIPAANRRALVNGKFIAPYPRAALAEESGERHVVHRGGGAYDVIVGRKINDTPMSKDEADELATRP